MTDSAALDSFARDNLPPRDQWPDLPLGNLTYPDRLNCVTPLLDDHVAAGDGARACVRSPTEIWSYADLLSRVNRIANALVHQLGMIPGNRVLLRAPNTPMMVAAYFAVIKAGGIAVATMPLLRARELGAIIDKSRINLALCDHRLLDELHALQKTRDSFRVIPWGGSGSDDLLAMMAHEFGRFRSLPYSRR